MHSRTKLLFFSLVCALAVLTLAELALAQSGTWTTKAPMLTRVVAPAGGVIGGKLFIVGGTPPPGASTTLLQVYDPVANSWSTRASAFTPRSIAAAGVINGKLYVVGGAVNGDRNTTTNALEVYDPLTDTWQTKAPMPTPRNSLAAGVIDGKLHVIGGVQTCGPSCTTLPTHEVYDPATNTWSVRAPLPTPRWGHVAAVLNGKLWVAGGVNPHPTPIAVLEVYDPLTDTWQTKASMPTALDGAGIGVIAGRIHVVGGGINTLPLGTHVIYDPTTNAWTTETSMPTARFLPLSGVIDDIMYVVGGVNSSGILGTNEAFTPALQQNRPPVANAGPDQTVECTSPAGAQVRLDGSASFDPDGDPLSFLWREARGSVLGTTAIVNTTLPLNGHILTLTATDPGGLSGTDTTEVTVRDTRAPSISVPGPDPREVIVSSVPAPRSALGLPAPTVSDVCDPAPQVTDNAPASFSTGLHTITFTARDRSGNSAQARLDVDVSLRFSFFDVFAEVELDDRKLEMRSVFQLGPGNNGLDVARDRLRFRASGGSVNISFELPLSAFRLRPNGRLTFEGMVSGLRTEMQIRPLGGGRFRIDTEIVGLSLSGLQSPLAVELRIGDDIGRGNAPVRFDD